MIQYNSINFRTWSKLGQRGSVFGVAAFEIVQMDAKMLIITADLGSLSGLERFKEKHPENFLNIGIAEQNMLGIGAGLANEGRVVFATTYATFITMRSCEQMRHYLGYMNSNLKLVGSGAGLIMGFSGNTHYTFEDLAIVRAIPNIIILSPADSTEAVKTAIAAAKYKGPVYIRLTGGLNNPIVYKNDYEFIIGKAVTLKEGGEITIFATGSMVYNSLKAAEMLEKRNIPVSIINMHTIKPLDIRAIEKAAENSRLLVAVEEHSKIGGLGGSVAECLSEMEKHPPLLRLGIDDKFRHAGDYNYLLEQNQLLPEQIAADIEKKYLSII